MDKIELTDAELDCVNGGSISLSFLNLQSVMSQRQLAFQLMSNLMQQFSRTSRSAIANIR